jgi:galactose oxidase
MAFDRNNNENQLEVDEIQGDVLVGLQKDVESFAAFSIGDVPAFRRFLVLLAPRITTLRTTLERQFILDVQKEVGTKERFNFIGVNIGFTWEGLSKLEVTGVEDIEDAAFRAGLAARAASLNDPTEGDGAPENWLVGALGQALHGMLIVTGPDEDRVNERVSAITSLAGRCWSILHQEAGRTRAVHRGHEHFDFMDGVSQPGVRGQINDAFPSHRFLTPSENRDDAGQGKPGQDLIWPGEFMFGYPSQRSDDLDNPGPSRKGGPDWMRNGSFMVFRRLKQLVPEYRSFIDEEAQALDMDPEALAARTVGRWPSGAPLVLAPMQDNPALAKDDLLVNNFEFSADAAGRRCPFAAHIRKSYPRDDITPAGAGEATDFERRDVSEKSTQTHRILRAGIPYGEEVGEDEQIQGTTLRDRGLMFVCYQTSIERQFEFILKQWVNNPDFPPGQETSEDPILGQTADRVRHFRGAGMNYPHGPTTPPIEIARDFVIPTGGGYFFVPSIRALAQDLAGEADTRPAMVGKWDDLLAFPNVPVHTHLLPNGTVLFWGRRDHPDGTMDEHECTPQIWDPVRGTFTPTPQPATADGTKVNLFCSGHTFLPDGLLLVTGGHWTDSHGLHQACTYDWRDNTWTPLPVMNDGRWYPTATTLPDGSALTASGSGSNAQNNTIPQIWDGRGWREVNAKVLSLYPRLIVLPDGRVFVAGTDPDGNMLDSDGGIWTAAPNRIHGDRQYAPAIMYAPGKVIFIGGGNDPDSKEPTNAVELIDFNDGDPAWRLGATMKFRRRQHNATLLPDGTVLVTGGTRGGGFDNGFNDLSEGKPVRNAELWDPGTGQWSTLAVETNERCYHSTALLLPDGRVLSGGGGEYAPHGPLAPEHIHRDAQVFNPPYLFKGPRPSIEECPDHLDYSESFPLGVSGPDVARITAVRTGSVTHSLDCNQRLVELRFERTDAGLTVHGPADRNACPPGYYMLFILSAAGVPSISRMVRIGSAAIAARAATTVASMTKTALEMEARRPAPSGTRVVVGLTSRCPYGLAACWGGAYQSLKRLPAVASVSQEANAAESTAELFLNENGIPDLAAWKVQFKQSANGSYDFRGIEITLEGTVRTLAGHLLIRGTDYPPVELRQIGAIDKIQWDWDRKAPLMPTAEELDAFASLSTQLGSSGRKSAKAKLTGPFQVISREPVLFVRKFELLPMVPRNRKAPAGSRRSRKRV